MTDIFITGLVILVALTLDIIIMVKLLRRLRNVEKSLVPIIQFQHEQAKLNGAIAQWTAAYGEKVLLHEAILEKDFHEDNKGYLQ